MTEKTRLKCFGLQEQIVKYRFCIQNCKPEEREECYIETMEKLDKEASDEIN